MVQWCDPVRIQNAHVLIAGPRPKLGKAPAFRALALENASSIDDVNKGGQFCEMIKQDSLLPMS